MKYVYNDFGQLITEYQQHDSAVNTSTSPKVQYQYLTGSNNTIRPTKTIYPNGRELSYNYGTTNSTNDILGRVASLIDDDASSTHLVDYTYLGANTIIETTSPEPDIKYTLIGTTSGNDPETGDIYRGLDRHSRVKDSCWYNNNSSTDIDRIKYGYDKASNRTYRENTVASTNSKHCDEQYQYDFVHRLKSLERGNINTTTHSISNPNYEETWSLDETGNWREYQQDTDGDGTWNLIQSRTSNKVNEITNITETVGNSWTTPVYNKSGNMTTIPTPNDPTTSYTATYDAWNRLVKLEDDSNTITEYQYDGTRRRVIHKVYASGVLNHTKHLYYNNNWQLLEERRDTNTTPTKQFIWGNRYIDDLVLRDHDTNNDGTLNERLYALQDANWNVTSYVNETGTIQERYIYNAYGSVLLLDSGFAVISSSTIEPDHLYAGYNFDSDVNLYHVRNRVYHPMLGTWLQRDPIGYDGDKFSLHAYVLTPASMTDYSGLKDGDNRGYIVPIGSDKYKQFPSLSSAVRPSKVPCTSTGVEPGGRNQAGRCVRRGPVYEGKWALTDVYITKAIGASKVAKIGAVESITCHFERILVGCFKCSKPCCVYGKNKHLYRFAMRQFARREFGGISISVPIQAATFSVNFTPKWYRALLEAFPLTSKTKSWTSGSLSIHRPWTKQDYKEIIRYCTSKMRTHIFTSKSPYMVREFGCKKK